MKRILVGVDGSEISMAAAAFASELARDAGAKLLLACAADPTIPYGEYTTGEALADLDEMARRQALSTLSGAAAVLSLKGIEAEMLAIAAPAADSLAELARGEVDLVVVGHRSRNRVARALLGSVADRLVQICPRPVLVFR